MLELNQLYLMDCMEGMKQFPDKYFELAIVDPIYGDVTKGGYMTNPHTTDKLAKANDYHLSIWSQNKTPKEYFDELKRVSKNQIVWGGNYFQESINQDSQCWIVCDKENGNNHFADCELAWTSFNTAVRMFAFRWAGMLQGNMKDKEHRIHPTQKPVALYKWLLMNYAKQGDKILDTHVGSASSLLACYDMGFEYIGFEIDEDYYNMAQKRIEENKAQLRFF
jgi:site-specific DNA-methyltransferase (adenine-specific)